MSAESTKWSALVSATKTSMRAATLGKVAPDVSWTLLNVTMRCCALVTLVRFTVTWFGFGPALGFLRPATEWNRVCAIDDRSVEGHAGLNVCPIGIFRNENAVAEKIGGGVSAKQRSAGADDGCIGPWLGKTLRHGCILLLQTAGVESENVAGSETVVGKTQIESP